MRKATLIVFCFLSLISWAQEDPFAGKLGSWNVLNVSKDFNKTFGVFAEAQLRSLSFYNEFHYYEFKGGFHYDLDSVFSFIVGAGRYDTYSPGGNFESPVKNQEIRSWGEFRIRHEFRRARLDHRYRAEQRFTSNGYRNRFRYRLALTVPINSLEIKKGVAYVQCWNELFFTDKATYFERNRIYLGIGRRMTDHLTIQSGYLHQFDYNLTDETGRDFLQIAISLDL